MKDDLRRKCLIKEINWSWHRSEGRNWKIGWEVEESGKEGAEWSRFKRSEDKRLKRAWYLLRSKSWKEDAVIFKLESCQVKEGSLRRISLLHEVIQGLLLCYEK